MLKVPQLCLHIILFTLWVWQLKSWILKKITPPFPYPVCQQRRGVIQQHGDSAVPFKVSTISIYIYIYIFKYIIIVCLPVSNFKWLSIFFNHTKNCVNQKDTLLCQNIPYNHNVFRVPLQSFWTFSTAVCCKSHEGSTKRHQNPTILAPHCSGRFPALQSVQLHRIWK